MALAAQRGIAALLVLLAGWSAPAPAAPPDGGSQALGADQQASARHGFLWEARKAGRHAYLMGTLHVGLASDYPPDADTQRRLSQVDAIVLEDDVSQTERSGQALHRLAMYKDGEPGLDRRLDASLKVQCERTLASLGLPPTVAWRMKPWMLGSTMIVLHASALGFSPAYGTEAYLAELAGSLQKPIVELEGIEAQFAMLESAPWLQQVEFLRQTAQSIENGEAETELRSLVEAWRASDAPAMLVYLDKVRHSADPAERQWFERLVTARNAGMASSIDRLLQDGHFYLVAVGSLHFFGDDGLVEALRSRGYTVTPVAAAPVP